MSCTIPFRIGVTVPSAPTAADWREAARSAEGQGFDVLTVADHLVADCYPPLPALVSAAEVTKTLRVGTLVINNDLRNPVVLAKELATVDDLTGGRLEIGLGAGHGAPEYRAAGIRFDHPGVRVARLAESVEVIDRLLRGETVTFNGVYYQVHEHAVWPRPVQSPRPPILIGGGGLRVHELAARRADIIGFAGTGKTLADGMRHEPTGFPAAAVDSRMAEVDAFLADAGRSADDAGRSADDAGRSADGGGSGVQPERNALVQFVRVTDERAAVLDELGARFEMSVTVLAETPFVLVGTARQIADDMRAYRERWGLSYFSVFAHSMGEMAKVIPLLR